MDSLGMSFLALVPALLLCWYIYSKDRVEKEPFGLLFVLFAAGVAVYLPTILAENAIISLFDKAFADNISYSLTGVGTFLSKGAKVGHTLSCGFVAIALLEEGVKFLALYLLTFRNKNFSHLFDGVVYSVFVSLGFAAAENVRFAVMDGWSTFLLRSVTSVPAHMIFGIMMGICYTIWHTYKLARLKEVILEGEGVISIKKPLKTAYWLLLSFAMPFAFHGLYSFAELYDAKVIHIIYYCFILVFFVLSFLVIRRLSKADTIDDEVAFGVLIRKYPTLKDKEDTTLDDLEAMEREAESE